MGQKPIGSVWLLKKLPPWAVFVLVVLFAPVTVGGLRFGFEGVYYDTSLASWLGDPALGLHAAMASVLLFVYGVPRLLQKAWWHITTFVIAAGTGLATQWQSSILNKDTVANTYHLFVFAGLGYLTLSLLPVSFVAKRPRWARVIAWLCLLTYATLWVWDFTHGNFAQKH